MKKSIKIIGIFVLLLSTVVLMSSCKKDVSNLPGTWKVTAIALDDIESSAVGGVWTFRTDGTCTMECDFERWFDDFYYNVVTFNGDYSTKGNKTLTINSDKFNVLDENHYDKVICDFDILSLTKKTMMVSGTIKYNRYESNATRGNTFGVTVTLSKQ